MKRFAAAIAKLLLIAALVPVFALQTSAAGGSAYDPDAAMAYAEAEWNSGIGVCDQFVKACLAAGGVKVYAGDVEPVMNALLDAGYGTGMQQLTVNGDYVYESENRDKVSRGDVIFFKCALCNDYTHTVMASGFNAKGQLEIYGHNPAQEKYAKLGRFYHKTDDGVTHTGLEVWAVNMSTKAPDHEHVLWYDTEGMGVGKYEDVHPHEMYDECTVDGCDLKYYLGWTAKVRSCYICNPSPAGKPVLSLELNEEGGVEVAWTALPDVEEYQVWRGLSETGNYFKISTTPGAYITNAASNITPGATYYYRIVAVLKDGTEVESNVAKIKIPGELERPVVTLENDVDGAVIISWNSVPGAQGYRVFRAVSKDGEFIQWKENGVDDTDHVDASVGAGGTYYYKVVALFGENATESDVVSITCPMKDLVVNLAVDEDGVRVSWPSIAYVEEYQVWRSKKQEGSFTKLAAVTGTSISNSAVTPGVTYYYKVIAVMEDGTHLESPLTRITVPGELEKAEVSLSLNEDEKVVLSWAPVAGADGYRIFRASSADGEFKQWKENGPNDTGYTDKSVAAGGTYYYKIVALIGEVTTESDVVSITCPAKDLVVSLSADEDGVKVSWPSIAYVEEYQVWRSKKQAGSFTKLTAVTGTSISNSAVTPGVTYYYKVIAVMEDGTQLESPVAGITVPGELGRAEVSLSLNEAEKVVLTWVPVAGADGYRIFRASSADGEFKQWKENGPNDTGYTDNGVAAGGTYYYRVVALIGEVTTESDVVSITCPAKDLVVSLSADENGVKVSWPSIAYVEEYQVWRSKKQAGSFTELTAVTGTSISNSAVTPGVTYYYKVIAVMEDGTQLESPVAGITVPGELEKAVVNLSLNEAEKVVLSWTPVAGADGYRIFRAAGSDGEFKQWKENGPNDTGYTDNGVAAGGTYYYKVVALIGEVTTESDIVSITCPAKDLVVSLSADENGVKVSWPSIAYVEEYQVWRSKKQAGSFTKLTAVTGTSISNSAVTPGVTYYYKVIAVMEDGTQLESPVAGITVPGELVRAEVALSLNEAEKVVLSWTPVAGADGYRIFRAAGSDGEFKQWKENGPNDTGYTDNGVAAGGTYYYKVVALIGEVTTESDVVSITCPGHKLAAPTITVSTRASDGKPVINWTAVDGATGYMVYRSGTQNGTYTKLYISAVDKFSVTHTGAVAGNDYFYKVCALDGKSEGEFSAVKGVWCALACPTVTVKNRASDGKPTISWTAVEGATGYEVYRCGTSTGNYTKLITTAATKLSVTHTGAAVGNDYFYKVKAIYGSNASCNSVLTAAKGVWVDLKQPTVKVLNSVSTGKPVIQWEKVDYAVGYKVYVSETSDGSYKLLYSTTNPDKLSVTHTGAKAENDYFYKVVAVHKNSKCDSAYSAAKGVWCDIARPTLTVSLNSKGKPYLKWTESVGADAYKVYRSTDGNTWTLMYTAEGNDLDVAHTGAKSGVNYSYKVLAISNINSKANSAYSLVKSITSK